MNRSEQLKDASLRLFFARCCGQKTPTERRRDVEIARGELKRAVRRWRWIGMHEPQREFLNRRQRRAQREGVKLWNLAYPFGIEVAQRKW